jgi:hypothetical protein
MFNRKKEATANAQPREFTEHELETIEVQMNLDDSSPEFYTTLHCTCGEYVDLVGDDAGRFFGIKDFNELREQAFIILQEHVEAHNQLMREREAHLERQRLRTEQEGQEARARYIQSREAGTFSFIHRDEETLEQLVQREFAQEWNRQEETSGRPEPRGLFNITADDLVSIAEDVRQQPTALLRESRLAFRVEPRGVFSPPPEQPDWRTITTASGEQHTVNVNDWTRHEPSPHFDENE